MPGPLWDSGRPICNRCKQLCTSCMQGRAVTCAPATAVTQLWRQQASQGPVIHESYDEAEEKRPGAD